MEIRNRPTVVIGDSLGFLIPTTYGRLDDTKTYDLEIRLSRKPDPLCICEVCGDGITELHHLVPKSIGGTDRDGRRYLCKKHHDILHNHILKFLWNTTSARQPDAVQDAIRQQIKKECCEWILRNNQAQKK